MPRTSRNKTWAIVAVGDVHGNYRALARIGELEPDAHLIVQTGDLTDLCTSPRHPRTYQDPRTLAPVAQRLLWVPGNHEDWDLVDQAEATGEPPLGRRLIPGTVFRLGPLTFGGVGGNYSPRWSYVPTGDLPPSKRRHYTLEQIDTVSRHAVNVLIAHESFFGQGIGRAGADFGQPTLTALVDRLQPTLFLSGHHHQYAETRRGRTLAISLPHVDDTYARVTFDDQGRLLSIEARCFVA